MTTMGCCAGFMKWTIIVLNVLIFLTGLVAVGFGIYILVDKSDILDLIGNTSDMPALLDKTTIVLIVGGGLVSLLAAIGVCGAWKTHRRLLCVYGTSLVLVLIVEIVIIVLAVVYREEIQQKFKTTLTLTFQESYVMSRSPDDSHNGFSKAWDSIQYELECCGVSSHIDYKDATYWLKTDNLTSTDTEWPVPLSCCRYDNPWVYPDDFDELSPQAGLCFPNWKEENTWNNAGCFKEMKSQLQKASLMIIGVCGFTIVTQILLLLFAWSLFCGCCGTKEVLV